MRTQIEGTESEMRAAQSTLDAHHGYPRKGVQIGGGRHVVIPDTYYPGAPGWTATAAAPERHPSKAVWALHIDATDAARVGKPLLARASDWTPKLTELAVEDL